MVEREFDIEQCPGDPYYPRTDEYAAATTGPVACLLKMEVIEVIKAAKMTPMQSAVFGLAMIDGYGNTEIARALVRSGYADMTRQGVAKHLELAIRKAERVQHRGVITVIVEQFGWTGLRDLMRE